MKELKEKLKGALLASRAICDEVDKAGRDFTPEEREKVAGHLDEAGKLKEQIKQKDADTNLRATVAALGAGIDLSDGRQDNGDTGVPPAVKGTMGQRFVESPAIKAWMASFPNGEIPASVKGVQSPVVAFRNFFARKELIVGDSDTSAGAFVETDYTRIYEALGRMPLVLRNLIATRQTTSDLVEFVRQTVQVTQAAAVPEANVTDYEGATGEVSGEKPEGTSNWEKVQAAVKTIAVWIPATKRALSDASQLRGLIDQELTDDLNEELEDQIVNGDGIGENFTGVLNTAGILAQAWNTDIITTTRQALTTLRTTGRARPTAWLLNPTDMETLDLLQDADGRYYWGGPMREGPRTLWGIPIVESETQTAGTSILGDWKKAVLWDRERATLSVSDSHNDFFIRNMVAILAELRAAFGLIRPSAFIEVEMESGS